MNGASHSTAAGPSLNGSSNMAVFMTHYCPAPFHVLTYLQVFNAEPFLVVGIEQLKNVKKVWFQSQHLEGNL